MSSSDRQNRLLVAEDWKRIYQTLQKADFQSYDFENLRRVMINYLRQNYPEDFNDYIQSSEYLALIDLIAYLGQNLSFRIDLNARENFLELAERRESILRLARLLSYYPKRNTAASGLLKITSVRTSEIVTDSNNLILSNQNIIWNDPSNPNWYEQFIIVMNTLFDSNQKFGNPEKQADVEGIYTAKYNINSLEDGTLGIKSFSKNIDGSNVAFEVVPIDIEDSKLVESAPIIDKKFSIIFREDYIGPASNNTGFFCMFKQGTIDSGDFQIENPSANQLVTIDAININNDDIWLYKLDNNSNESDLWNKISSIAGNNTIYNDISKKTKNIYSVLSRLNDRISLIFSDGVFGDLPRGSFRVYYRTSRNLSYSITPKDMSGIGIDIDYRSQSNKIEKLSITLELQYTVSNASQSESNDEVKRLAPMQYYTQNRLITAEDYQIGPLLSSNEIIKTKSVNRISSGISRYFDLIDATGKYSSTNLLGFDGIIYKENYIESYAFTFETLTDIEGILYNAIDPIVKNTKVSNFYYDSTDPIPYVDLNVTWLNKQSTLRYSSGSLLSKNNLEITVGPEVNDIFRNIRIGTVLKFDAPNGFHFTSLNKLEQGEANYAGSKTYIYATVQSVYNNGVGTLDNGEGPIVLNENVPTGAILSVIRPFINKKISQTVKTEILNLIFEKKFFGLRFDIEKAEWMIILEENLNTLDAFNVGNSGDNTGQKVDSSWLLKFVFDGVKYIVEYRVLRFVFESEKQIRFYTEETDKIFDTVTGRIVKDKITVLNINTTPLSLQANENGLTNYTNDFTWEITAPYRETLGYISSKKVEVNFFDSDDDGVPDNVSLFDEIVGVYNTDKFIFQQKITNINGVETYEYVDKNLINVQIVTNETQIGPYSQYENNQLFYISDTNSFKILNKNKSILEYTYNYKAFVGRDKLKFSYVHSADVNSRLDPSVSNIIDIYLLTKSYDNDFRNYANNLINAKPVSLTSDELYLNYSGPLEEIKSLTDEIIYHPAKYRILFGSKADPELQAKFKVVKNTDISTNDNFIKSEIIQHVNEFFALENWDFGETFYMTELSAYITYSMSPKIVSIVLVPLSMSQTFGSLYEIKADDDEIFISGATIKDIDIVDELNAVELRLAIGSVRNTA